LFEYYYYLSSSRIFVGLAKFQSSKLICFGTDRQIGKASFVPVAAVGAIGARAELRLLLFFAVVGSRCSPVPLDTAWGLGGHLEPLRGMSASSIKGITLATWSKHILRGWVLSINTPHARLSSEQIQSHVRSYAVEGSYIKKGEAGRNISSRTSCFECSRLSSTARGHTGPRYREPPALALLFQCTLLCEIISPFISGATSEADLRGEEAALHIFAPGSQRIGPQG